MKYLLVDAGNSLCKITEYDFEIDSLGDVQSYQYEHIEADLFNHPVSSGIKEIWVSNVNNEQLNLILERYAASIDKPVVHRLTSGNGKSVLSSKYEDLNKLGCDRWAAMLAIIYGKQCETFCVIDCGTAITIDLVIDNIHQGGMIAPGINTSFQSLNRNTAHLPKVAFERGNSINVDIGNSIKMIGQTTEECIVAGVYYQAIALIERTLQNFQVQYNTSFTPFITGGDAQILMALSELDFVYGQNFVLQGLKEIIRNKLM